MRELMSDGSAVARLVIAAGSTRFALPDVPGVFLCSNVTTLPRSCRDLADHQRNQRRHVPWNASLLTRSVARSALQARQIVLMYPTSSLYRTLLLFSTRPHNPQIFGEHDFHPERRRGAGSPDTTLLRCAHSF